ncbi:MAG: DUF898 family protein [Pseudomonadota bacterium]
MTTDHAISAGAPSVDKGAPVGFEGGAGRLASITTWGVVLTVLTLGIYRFWMRTDLRRYYWGSIRIDGEPLEYTGRGLELFLGFLIAVFFLGVYLFAGQMIFSTLGLFVANDLNIAILLSALLVLPFIPYAQYRGQRYLLSRTRWRGVRFGLDKGALSYTGRSLLWWIAVILSLGIAWPFSDFDRRRFITRRTFYGDQKFNLTGGPGGLFKRYILVWLILVGTAIGFGAIQATMLPDPTSPVPPPPSVLAIVGMIALYLVLILAFVWYGAYRIRYFMNHTEFGEGVLLRSEMRPWRAVGITLGGLLLTILVSVIVGVIVAVGFGLVGTMFGSPEINEIVTRLIQGELPDLGEALQLAPFVVLIVVAYILIAMAIATTTELFISRPYIRHMANTAAITNIERAYAARQRAHDQMDQSEGFADALDVGAF